MDTITSNSLAIVALVLSVGGTVFGIINHKKCRSKCGQKVLEASLDISNTTPPSDKSNLGLTISEPPSALEKSG